MGLYPISTPDQTFVETVAAICFILMPISIRFSGVVRGSRGVTALYHCFLDKITVIPLSEGNYSFASVTEKVKRYLAHKVLPLPHCKL